MIKQELREIIKEEIRKVLKEGGDEDRLALDDFRADLEIADDIEELISDYSEKYRHLANVFKTIAPSSNNDRNNNDSPWSTSFWAKTMRD